MKKVVFAVLLFLLTLSVSIAAYAYDLPIDITAIGRQDIPTGRVTHRIGANLFTEDAQRINNILAQQVQQRQEAAHTLFETATVSDSVDPHTRVMATAYSLDLFSQPVTLTTFNTAADSTSMPMWLIILILVACSAVGFVLALKSLAKRRRQAENVY